MCARLCYASATARFFMLNDTFVSSSCQYSLGEQMPSWGPRIKIVEGRSANVRCLPVDMEIADGGYIQRNCDNFAVRDKFFGKSSRACCRM